MMFGDVNSPRELEDDEITIESSRVRLTYGSKASIRVPIASLVQRVTWERELVFFLPLCIPLVSKFGFAVAAISDHTDALFQRAKR